MFMFKAIFARNKMISCDKTNEETEVQGTYAYADDRGRLLYALIKADTRQEACAIAEKIVHNVSQKFLGREYSL